jgi:hypothetical protein
MSESKNPTSITDLVRAIEEEVTASANNQVVPDGTVLDDAGNLVKLGEEAQGYEIIYGHSIELPDNLLPSANQPE